VYASGSLSLCALEVVVHNVSLQMLRSFKYARVDIPEKLILNVEDMNKEAFFPLAVSTGRSKRIGDEWFDNQLFPVLRVPSVVIPIEYNYLINPSHPDYPQLRIGEPQSFGFDKRLLKSLGLKTKGS